jgi:hypothetical protein
MQDQGWTPPTSNSPCWMEHVGTKNGELQCWKVKKLMAFSLKLIDFNVKKNKILNQNWNYKNYNDCRGRRRKVYEGKKELFPWILDYS